jgi:hypothetical protein
MVTENFEMAVGAAEDLLKEGIPLKRCNANIYSKVVHAAFERIRTMKGKGFSFAQICGAYEKAGLLPGKSRAGSFRQAFQRERARRMKEDELKRLIEDGGDAEKNTESAANANKAASSMGSRVNKPDQQNQESEKERMRRLTGTAVDTGLGKIIRHADGSFEY